MFIQGKIFGLVILICIIGNTIALSLENIISVRESILLTTVFNYIFISELVIKLYALGSKYPDDYMNIIDAIITVLSIIEMTFINGTKAINAFRTLRVFRTFKVLRMTKVLRGLVFVSIIVNVLMRSMLSLAYIGLLLLTFNIIYSLIGMQLFYNINISIHDKNRTSYNSFLFSFLQQF